MKYLIFAALILAAGTCHAGTKIVETDDEIIVEITGTPDPQAQAQAQNPVPEQKKPPVAEPKAEPQQEKKDYAVNGRKKTLKDIEEQRAQAEARRQERLHKNQPTLSKPFAGPGSN